jgi:hypothetical protein
MRRPLRKWVQRGQNVYTRVTVVTGLEGGPNISELLVAPAKAVPVLFPVLAIRVVKNPDNPKGDLSCLVLHEEHVTPESAIKKICQCTAIAAHFLSSYF